DQPDRGALLRARDGGADASPDRVPQPGQARPAPHVAAHRALRDGAGDRSRADRKSPAMGQPRPSGRSALRALPLVRDDPVGRVRGRLPGLAPRRERMDDLAQDHVTEDMSTTLVAAALLALAPVLGFLALLVLLDSYKLVSLAWIV